MLKILQSANPISFLFLLLYFAALNIHPVLYSTFNPIQLQTPVFHWLFAVLMHWDVLSPAYLFYISISCIFIQGILLSILLQAFKITPKLNLVPAALYYLLFYLFTEYIAFTPPLMLQFFILLLLSILFRAYNVKHADTYFFNAGFLQGFISLLYFPASIFALFSLNTLFAVRSSSLREALVYISGIFTILFLMFTACFWFDNTALLTDSIIIPFSHHTSDNILLLLAIKSALLLFFLLPAAAFVINRSGKVLVQIRKYLAAFLMLGIFAIIAGFLYSSVSVSTFAFATLPIAVIIGYYFSNLKNRDTAEILHLTLMGIVFTFQYINFAQ